MFNDLKTQKPAPGWKDTDHSGFRNDMHLGRRQVGWTSCQDLQIMVVLYILFNLSPLEHHWSLLTFYNMCFFSCLQRLDLLKYVCEENNKKTVITVYVRGNGVLHQGCSVRKAGKWMEMVNLSYS